MFPSKTAPERKADFLVHAAGLAFLAPASALLVEAASRSGSALLIAGVVIYALAALFSISISFAYHLLPRHEWRANLRRWDHAAIYVVIAGVFSPLLIVCGTWSAFAIGGVLWVFALIGAVFKLAGGNPDSNWSLYSYLGMGWFALVALPDFTAGLPKLSLALIASGGIFYTVGTLFYRRKAMLYRYPIWHAFGTCGGLSFFASVWIAVTGA
ncbi:hemolysin III family protein [Erythrobacter sp. SCSIO 43205]|uniref:PAQR family membrane homeostasis protein TrhA n=1 Tax=Erythrobacter sp. SCSIO 43205 TaxID=2779361 RepID=UPI001CA94DD0|nr:hemolysin III family protein [Erythrobacter sp. SCSIO 43205]UAB77406.1 hemolysin III family protein [Erythrobacter sp. SCSIO 43205]